MSGATTAIAGRREMVLGRGCPPDRLSLVCGAEWAHLSDSSPARTPTCPWNKPSSAFFHLGNPRKRKGLSGLSIAASCGGSLFPCLLRLPAAEAGEVAADRQRLRGCSMVPTGRLECVSKPLEGHQPTGVATADQCNCPGPGWHGWHPPLDWPRQSHAAPTAAGSRSWRHFRRNGDRRDGLSSPWIK